MTEQSESMVKRWYVFADDGRYYVERAWQAQDFGHAEKAAGSYDAMQAVRRLLSGEAVRR